MALSGHGSRLPSCTSNLDTGTVRKTLKHILTEYGATAVVVYLTIFFAVLLAAWGAIHLGWQLDGMTQNVGAFTAAYLATKVTQPLRIAATLALTPLVVRVMDRFRPRAEGVAEQPGGGAEDTRTPPERVS